MIIVSREPSTQIFHCYAYITITHTRREPTSYYIFAGIPRLWEGTLGDLHTEVIGWENALRPEQAGLTSIAVFPSFSANVEDCMRIEGVVGTVPVPPRTHHEGIPLSTARIIVTPRLRPLIHSGWKVRAWYAAARMADCVPTQPPTHSTTQSEEPSHEKE